MITPDLAPQTYVRTINTAIIDRINGALDNLASDSDYFRPVPVKSPLGLYVMSVRSYAEVAESIDIGLSQLSLTALFDDKSDSVANESIATVPYGVRFPTPNSRSDASIRDEVEASGYNSLKGIRKVMITMKPVHDKLFCPPEFKNATRPLGAYEFYDDPVSVTVGWTDLATRREDMNARREEILETIASAAPFVLMDSISLEKV